MILFVIETFLLIYLQFRDAPLKYQQMTFGAMILTILGIILVYGGIL